MGTIAGVHMPQPECCNGVICQFHCQQPTRDDSRQQADGTWTSANYFQVDRICAVRSCCGATAGQTHVIRAARQQIKEAMAEGGDPEAELGQDRFVRQLTQALTASRDALKLDATLQAWRLHHTVCF